MKEVIWSDKIGRRSRSAALLVVNRGDTDCYFFRGGDDKNIKVIRRKFKKDGKWSHNTYTLSVADDVEVYPAHTGWESGKWREGLAVAVGLPDNASWQEIADKVDLPIGRLADLGIGRVVIRNGPLPQEGMTD